MDSAVFQLYLQRDEIQLFVSVHLPLFQAHFLHMNLERRFWESAAERRNTGSNALNYFPREPTPITEQLHYAACPNFDKHMTRQMIQSQQLSKKKSLVTQPGIQNQDFGQINLTELSSMQSEGASTPHRNSVHLVRAPHSVSKPDMLENRSWTGHFGSPK